MGFPLRPADSGKPEWCRHRAALIVTHPGHELFVHGWLEKAHPVVFVLTDGPGDRGWPLHLHSTARVLRRAGAHVGPLFGRFTNAALHRAILGGAHARFVALAEELAEALAHGQIDYVVGDAAEGQDVSHDVCRLLIDAAVAQARRWRPALRNYELVLDGQPRDCPPDLAARSLWVHLDAESWPRKHAAACGHPELAAEIDRAAERFGLESLEVECLRPAIPWSATQALSPSSRETWGPAARFHDHFLPLAQSLRSAANGGRRAAA